MEGGGGGGRLAAAAGASLVLLLAGLLEGVSFYVPLRGGRARKLEKSKSGTEKVEKLKSRKVEKSAILRSLTILVSCENGNSEGP